MKTLQNILKDISIRIASIYKNSLDVETDDFKRGFRYCQGLFSIAFMKDTDLPNTSEQYNKTVAVKELEDKLKATTKRFFLLQSKYDVLKQDTESTKGVFVKQDTFIHITKSLSKKFSIDEEQIEEIFNRYITK